MILIFLIFLAMPLHAEPLTENQSRFGAISGDVGLLSQGAVEWIEPHEGLPIAPGDHIRTGEDGRVELALSDKALWILEPMTDVVMEHTETDSGRLDLDSGRLLGKVNSERAAGLAQHWEFKTPAAVVGVRGTEFALDVSKADGTRLGVFEGVVDMQAAETAEGPQPTLQVGAGREAIARRGKSLQTSTHWSPVMTTLMTRLVDLRRRQKHAEDTWSPFTTTVRAELRRRFVSPAPKYHPVRRVPRKPRRRPTPPR